ncbi:DUF2442 domain-containing protein, partial [Acidithiobacillus thiooxidans]|uniref:DUF2442 domain-containing protein n=1 Tax=Acidithiobacillus thiooxidans TaxID=930 RepID=UPI0029C01C64
MWLLLDKDELFVSYAEFPWFKQATVEQITTIERQSSAHLYWPLLDVDLAVESIRNPASFPLVAKELCSKVVYGRVTTGLNEVAYCCYKG